MTPRLRPSLDTQTLRHQPATHLSQLPLEIDCRTTGWSAAPVERRGYASANGPNGPVTNTLLTLLAGLAILAPFSPNEEEDDGGNGARYADMSSPITLHLSGSHTEVGITRRSA